MPRKYPDPFVPREFSCWVHKASTRVTQVDRKTGKKTSRKVDRWDVRGKANGIQFSKRFERAGLAQSWKERLDRGFADGLLFDVRNRCFVNPDQSVETDTAKVPTVFSVTEAFFRANSDWEPETKMLAASALNRARRALLAEDANPTRADLEGVDDYLNHASFLPDHGNGQITPRQKAGRAWLEANSAAIEVVTTSDLETFISQLEVNQRDPSKRVGAMTIVRYLQPLRACWTWAMARDEIRLARNPWTSVRVRRKSKTKSTRSERGGRDHLGGH